MSEPSVTITQPRVSLVLSLIAVVGIGWQVSSYANSHENRIGILETERLEQRQLNKEIVSELKGMSKTITELIVTLREIEKKQ